MSNLFNTNPGAASISNLAFGIAPTETDYFAEGIAQVSRPAASKKSRSTSAYLQGTEIQDFADYASGLVKITSGEQYNALLISAFGQYEQDHAPATRSPVFYERQNIDANPISALNGSTSRSQLIADGNAQQLDDHGQPVAVIEPFTIRTAASMMSTYYPFEAHRVWGTVEEGNLTAKNASDEVVIVYDKDRPAFPAFFDAVTNADLESAAYFVLDVTTLSPWADVVYSDIFRKKLTGQITGTTNLIEYSGSYVLENERSATTGFIFESAYGTDSIAFSGMMY